jgi:hypothetical protein
LEEQAGRDRARAILELVQSADAVVKKLKGLDELVVGNLVKPVVGEEVGILCVVKRVSEEDTQLIEHLDGPEDEWLVGLVALLEVRPHGGRGEVQGESACNDVHCRDVDVLEGQVADELGLHDGADVREVSMKVVHTADGCACGDGHLDLAEVLLGFAEEFFGFAVVGGRLMLLGQRLGLRDEVEVVESLLLLPVSSMDCINETS